MVRVHQHDVALPRDTGARPNCEELGDEPADHAIVRSRGGLTAKSPPVADGEGRALAFILAGGQAADTTMLPGTLDGIRLAGATGRPRKRPDRLLADKGHPSKANRAWLRERGIATTIPESAAGPVVRSTPQGVHGLSMSFIVSVMASCSSGP
ncbi:transposase [Streptomyces sp. PU_AKi4]|uniref:transposase n=1 Tax=Streptomyces sp. PU_AKi4 TaxID=2800809 RepID=UPI00352580B1